MPSTTSYDFGDVVLVPFPFTDQSGTKKRPSIIASSAAYNAARSDIVVMAVTSRLGPQPLFGEVVIVEWKKAGLIKPSAIKPVLSTLDKRLVIQKLGRLEPADQLALQNELRKLLG